MNIKGLDRLFKFVGFRINDIIFSEHCVQVYLAIDKRYKLFVLTVALKDSLRLKNNAKKEICHLALLA